MYFSTRNVQKLRAKAVATCGELVFLASIVIGQNMVPKKYLKPALKRANAKVRFILFIQGGPKKSVISKKCP